MPTNLVVRRTSARRSRSASNDTLQSDLTVLLLWTAAGLALFLLFVVLGLQPDMAQDWITLG
jgi:hypothetical protein